MRAVLGLRGELGSKERSPLKLPCLATLRKRCFFAFLGVALVFAVPIHAAKALADGEATPQHFRIDQVVEDDWGKLVTVYDQPTYQRFTFESDTQVTVLHVGLVWDNKEGTYRPNVRQVIHLVKKPSRKPILSGPQPTGNVYDRR
jgi:hypothetical protein